LPTFGRGKVGRPPVREPAGTLQKHFSITGSATANRAASRSYYAATAKGILVLMNNWFSPDPKTSKKLNNGTVSRNKEKP